MGAALAGLGRNVNLFKYKHACDHFLYFRSSPVQKQSITTFNLAKRRDPGNEVELHALNFGWL